MENIVESIKKKLSYSEENRLYIYSLEAFATPF